MGVVTADFEHAWRPGKEYHYLVRSRTLTGLDDIAEQFSGVLMKAVITVQRRDSDTLRAKVSKSQYAHVHKLFEHGRDTEIPDPMLELQDMPMSGKPFDIKMRHGVITDLITERDVSTWEVNILKGIISQFQVDSLGENAMKSKGTQPPSDKEPFAMFRSMEDSVGGKCETTYDITPLSESVLVRQPELVPMPHLKEDQWHMEIIKNRNYSKCSQRVDYHFGLTGKIKMEAGANANGNFLTRSSMSRVIVSGNLKRFTIQSSVTENKMFASPRLFDNYPGVVYTKMNLTLVSFKDVGTPLPDLENPESIGNLVYTYNNPFSESEQRRLGRTGSSTDHVPSETSSMEDASVSNSKEDGLWQPKPTLEDPPQFPLLPLFTGNNGKAVGLSKEVNPVEATKELVKEISTELSDPSTVPTQQTLEKFTILISLIRTMSRKQIAEAEKSMHLPPNEVMTDDKSWNLKRTVRAVFCDAMAEAGTGPALLTIKNMIENRNIEGFEAADILSRLSKSAITPTGEYVDTFFELVKNPVVMKQPLLNSTALLAFTELVRYSQISNSSIHNRYPVHSFGRLSSKHNQAVLRTYIPFLAEQLREAVKDGDSPRIQTYIVALGNIGHPKILAVFEPYLEGKIPVSTFQRTMMVSALSKLAELHPRLTRSVLYKIYLNANDVHDVRCVAVYLLMKTNPPLVMMQRMAEFSRHDPSKHVRFAVISTIRTVAQLKRPETRELAMKAKAAVPILETSDYHYDYSKGFVTDSTVGNLDLAYRLIVNTIGSEDSVLARALYIGLDTSYGDFKIPPRELQMMVSSIRALTDKLWNKQQKRDSTEKTHTEKIAEMLNMEPDDPIQVEGHGLWNTIYVTNGIFFDNHTLERLPSLIAKGIAEFKNGHHFNFNRLTNYEITLSFPTETGLPFVYNVKIPSLLKSEGNAKIRIGDKFDGEVGLEIRTTLSAKFQGRMGFVTPFDHQQFTAGVDVNAHVYMPLKVQTELNVPEKSLEVKLWPMEGESKARILHYSIIPYTSRHDILTLRPIATDKNTQKVVKGDLSRRTEHLPSIATPIVKLQMELDGLESNTYSEGFKDDPLAIIALSWARMNNKYQKTDGFANFASDTNEPITLKVMFDWTQVNSEPSDSDDSQEWDPNMMKVDASGLGTASDERRKQYLKEAANAITFGEAYVLDARLNTQGMYKARTALTVAWADSKIDDKKRILLFSQLKVPDNDVEAQLCVATNVKSNVDQFVDFETALKSKPKMDIDVDVRYGKTCLDGGHIEMKGKLIRRYDLEEEIQKSPDTKKCYEQMKEGNMFLRACRNAKDKALELGDLDATIDHNSPDMQAAVDRLLGIAGWLENIESHVEVISNKPSDDNKINIRTWSSPDSVSAMVHTSSMQAFFPNILDINGIAESQDLGPASTENMIYDDGKCMLDITKAETFDGRIFPLKLGKCWHVAMTTYPKENSDNPNKLVSIPEDMMVSLLTREVENGKEVKVILGNDEVLLSPSGSSPKVTVNGMKVPLSQKTGFQQMNDDGELMFELIETSSGIIRLMSDKYELDIATDGKRIRIMGDEKYRTSVRGLCGNYDGNPENDFISPKKCLLTNSEEFTASYALTNDQCEGPALDISRRVQKSECKRESVQINDVINDIEAGRVSSVRRNWGYHTEESKDARKCNAYRTQVVEREDEICFSTRPILACAEECRATETKSKNYKFYCTKKTDASLEMKKRIEKGANPDLSEKPVSLTQAVQVPLECQA